jgi:hypothetical protein
LAAAFCQSARPGAELGVGLGTELEVDVGGDDFAESVEVLIFRF